jgi:hypothetical protein
MAVKDFGCTRLVFLTGHLADQVEYVVRAYAPAPDLVFMRDREREGTASAAFRALDQLGVSQFLYSHGNIALTSVAVRRLVRTYRRVYGQGGVWGVSRSAIAPTHPELPVLNGVISTVQEATPRSSVGMGIVTGMNVRGHCPDVAGRTFEAALLERVDTIEPVSAVELGMQWSHIEDLSAYVEPKPRRESSPKAERRPGRGSQVSSRRVR